MEEERGKFNPLAQSTATSFFKIQDLSGLNNMYTTGLHVILVLYDYVLLTYRDTGVRELTSRFIALTVRFVQHMSSKEHEIAICLHLLNGLFPHQFKNDEWETFLQSDRDLRQRFKIIWRG